MLVGCVDDFDLNTLAHKFLAGLRDPTQHVQQVAVKRTMFKERKRGVEEVVDFAEISASIDEDLVAAESYDGVFGDIGLVHDLAHELFENILERDQPIHAAVLVDHDPHMHAARLKIEQ